LRQQDFAVGNPGAVVIGRHEGAGRVACFAPLSLGAGPLAHVESCEYK